MQFEDFDLVLKDIQPFLSAPVFEYFISIMHDDVDRQERELSCSGNSSDSNNRHNKFSRRIMDGVSGTEKVPLSGKTLKSKASKSSGSLWYPAKARPIREKGTGPESDILCSQLPVCRNIVSKVYLKEAIEGDYEAGGSEFEEEEEEEPIQFTSKTKIADEKLYKEIIGKIVELELDPTVLPVPTTKEKNSSNGTPSVKKIKGSKKKGVCNYSHPVTNPLYKEYNPAGYIKSDEELARDFILGFMGDFNTWLAGLEGNLVQVDPEIIFKILRKDLEEI